MSRGAATRVAAVDLGASSVRVCVCDLDRRPLGYEVVHRVAHQPRRAADGVLRWDWELIAAAVREGLEIAASRPLASVGIDTWAVDYGLLDGTGRLLASPACYRDDRTAGYASVIDRVGEQRLYEIAGLQNLSFNTIFQLAAEDRDQLAAAAHILTLPELIVHDLTGQVTAETTSAGSTGLVDQSTRMWSDELLSAIDVDRSLLPDILPPGTKVGKWNGVDVHLVAGHDTASAVVGIAAEQPSPCFVASGTWLLAGQELEQPVLADAARLARFTNEYGPQGTTRFLKNIAGFWIIEQCRLEWGDVSIERLFDEAAGSPEAGHRFDATDPRFLAPQSMLTEVIGAADLPASTTRGTTVSVILDSLAQTTVDVLHELRHAAGRGPETVHLVGGGVRAGAFVDRLRERLDVRLTVGAAESAALGNAMMQGIALGVFDDLATARRALVP